MCVKPLAEVASVSAFRNWNLGLRELILVFNNLMPVGSPIGDISESKYGKVAFGECWVLR